MSKRILLGWRRHLLPLPAGLWQRRMAGRLGMLQDHLAFMTPTHHRVRNLAVREIARTGQPLAPEAIAQRLGLPLERVGEILDQLQRGMTFLYRNPQGEVIWAYPVTVEKTPHVVELENGQQVHAA